ncbi:hypothetical protein A9W99_12455 [Mycobacterium sp. 1164966.3]|nr:hypothetical protein A9W99_12455 [Mycobacterium sp. 1164966.3]
MREWGGPRFATRLCAYLTTGIVLIGVSASAAMPVASDLPEIQARSGQLDAASDSATEILAALGLEVGEGTGKISLTRGLQDVVGLENSPVGRVSGRADFSGFNAYAELATNTSDRQKSLGQTALHDPWPMATQIIANQVGYPRMSRNARGSLSDVADGVIVASALPTAFGVPFSGDVKAELVETQIALLNLLITFKLKVVLLQTALLNFLVNVNRNMVLESLGGTHT